MEQIYHRTDKVEEEDLDLGHTQGCFFLASLFFNNPCFVFYSLANTSVSIIKRQQRSLFLLA